MADVQIGEHEAHTKNQMVGNFCNWQRNENRRRPFLWCAPPAQGYQEQDQDSQVLKKWAVV